MKFNIIMKNLLYFILFLMTMVISSSCSEDEYYSCDPVVNKFVVGHLEDVIKMTPQDWWEVGDISYQRGIFNAFSVDQKINLWYEKINELLKLEWSLMERNHLLKLQISVKDNRSWFLSDCPEEIMNQNDLFQYQWIDYARNILHWNDELIFAVAFSPLKVNETKSLFVPFQSSIKTSSEAGQMVCDCHNPESAHYLVCDNDEGYECIEGHCSEVSWGCGWLWTTECNGLCYHRAH